MICISLFVKFAGGMAGVGCWMVSYPSDVLKTRWQADGVIGKRQYSNLSDCIKQTSVDGAVYNPRSAYWRGFGATAFRAFPGMSAKYQNYILLQKLKKNLKQKSKFSQKIR